MGREGEGVREEEEINVLGIAAVNIGLFAGRAIDHAVILGADRNLGLLPARPPRRRRGPDGGVARGMKMPTISDPLLAMSQRGNS